MISTAHYSPRTVCPECHARIRLEEVVFTPQFDCPHCGEKIHISDRYRRVMNWTVYLLGFVIPYLIGVRSWFLLLAWIPSIWVLAGLWAYVGIYFLPPRLSGGRSEPKYPSILGLGPGPPSR